MTVTAPKSQTAKITRDVKLLNNEIPLHNIMNLHFQVTNVFVSVDIAVVASYLK